MREAVLGAMSTDWRAVEAQVLGPAPGGRAVFYQKHITHHMLPGFGLDWMDRCANAFLIRAPEEVLASYTAKRAKVSLEEIGFVRQAELFDRVADRLGAAPPVVEGRDVQADPRGTLTRLCAALGIAFDAAMLAWPAGRRASDGVWAPVWYDAVERATGFAPPRPPVTPGDLPESLRPIAEAARPYYERLARHRLV
jgi:hypothetical protein